MALSIEDAETDRLVRRYAQLKGISYARAIRVAVSDALRRESDGLESATFTERIRPIQDRVAASPRRTDLTADEIIGYDEHGLPQ